MTRRNTVDRWRALSALYHEVLQRDENDRERFLAEACGDDLELRHDVATLLKYAVGESLSGLGLPNDGQSALRRQVLNPGQQLGSYEVRGLIGSGGMGEVYAAYDPRLKRDVAIKVASAMSRRPEQLQRLEREARAAAALNHPNILAIHDIGTYDGTPYIVMERVDGETLAERLRRGPLPLRDALTIGIAIADALAAAHARGVLHRDLKPANVMLTPEGRVKVLDFGLAKMTAPEEGAADLPASVQLVTRPGEIFGTPAYMAPEQLVGQQADHRADIYSLGVILFEMTTGERPFGGDDFLTIALNALTQPVPSPAAKNPAIPASVATLIAGCLAKERADRPESASVVRADLEQLMTSIGGAGTTRMSRRLSAIGRTRPARAAAVGVAAAGVVVASLAGVTWWRKPVVAQPPRRAVIAVLPLENLSGDASNGYLGVGIADALTTTLARLSAVSVVSREVALGSARQYSEPQKLARDLGVNLLVQGSLQRSGDRLRVDAKLTNAEGRILWAGDSESTLSDLFSIERQLAERLLQALQVTVSAAERRQLGTAPTQSAEALDSYWRGIAQLDRADPDAVDQAIVSFQRATALDSRFAAAHAALGTAYFRKYLRTNDRQFADLAVGSANTALSIDATQPEVRLALAAVYRQIGRNDDAIAQLREVLTTNPSNDEAHRQLGNIFDAQGQYEAALEQLTAAVSLRPDYWRNHDQLGMLYYQNGHVADAIRAFERVIELRPDSAQGYQRLGTAYQAHGDKAEAQLNLERAIAITPDPASYSNLGTLHYSQGRFADAAAAYESAIKLRPNRAIYHRNLGDAYARLGRQPESTAEYLEALRLTQTALDVNPRDARVIGQLAVYEAKVGRRGDAERHIAQALQLLPSNPEVLFRRAVVSALGGDTAAALEQVADAVARGYSVNLVREDDDLAALRPLPAFQALTAQSK